MPLPLVALGAAAGLKALGGWLGNRSKKKQQEAQYKNDQAQTAYQNEVGAQNFEENEKRRRQKGAFYLGIAKAYGLDKLLPPDVAGFIGGQDREYVKATTPQPIGTGQSALGGAISTVGDAFMPKFSPQALAAMGDGANYGGGPRDYGLDGYQAPGAASSQPTDYGTNFDPSQFLHMQPVDEEDGR